MKKFKKILLIFLIIIIIIGGIVYLLLRSTRPQLKGKIVVSEGLKENVLIKRNDYGIPLIEANSFPDVLFTVGFLHASDRLFQMELSRRNAFGQLSEIVGEIALDHDKQQKRLMIEESVQREAKKVPASLKELVESYCEGVNYFINNKKLPPEFTLLGFKPEPWELKDSFSILKNIQLMLEGSGSELHNFFLIQAFGKEDSQIFRAGEHEYSPIIKESELDSAFTNKMLLSLLEQERQISELNIGSNSWVISGVHTLTGEPILANDPHLSCMFPSYFYQIKAIFEDRELSGNTLPGVPFVVIGRNETIAWGFTNVGTDVIDYSILKINPENENQYLVDGNWMDFETITKTIPVKKQEDVVIKVKNSLYGPVIN
ncbi:MAG: penicillin acylase family protein, partial [Candidatus Aminicenantaceae bacterium]